MRSLRRIVSSGDWVAGDLLHPLVLSVALRGIRRLRWNGSVAAVLWQTVVLFGAVLAVSAVYFVTVERPCMKRRWPKRLYAWLRGRGHGVPEAAPAAGAR